MPTISDVDKLRLRFRRGLHPNDLVTGSIPGLAVSGSIPADDHHHLGPSSNRKRRSSEEEEDDLEERFKRIRRSIEENPEEKDCLSSSSCGAVNCSKHFAYTDVLLKPELLYQVRSEQDITSSNPLLEFCLDGGFKSPRAPLQEMLPPLLDVCSEQPFTQGHVERLRGLCQEIRLKNETRTKGERQRQLLVTGCDNAVNVRDSKGRTAMHFLINGCTKDSFYCTLQAIYLLLSTGLDVSAPDAKGHTPFTSLHALLDKDLFLEAIVLAQVLRQQSECNVNHVTKENRTLLSYCVTHGDRAADLTRLLINFGAKVWPDCKAKVKSVKEEDRVIEVLIREREQSAFTYFLKNVMDTDMSLRGKGLIINLLGHSMGEDPTRMKSHVTRAMLHLGRSFRTNGPLFAELKDRLEPFWTQPQPLKFLCLKNIRESIGYKNLADTSYMRTLDIPNTMSKFLQLN